MKITRNIIMLTMLIYKILCAGLFLPDSAIAVPTQERGIPVVLSHDTLFHLYGSLGPFSPQQRAAKVVETLQHILASSHLSPDSIRVVERDSYSTLVLDTLVIMAVTREDAAPLGKTPNAVASTYVETLKTSLTLKRERLSFQSLLINLGITLLLVVGLVMLLWLMTKVFPKIYARIETWEGTLFRPIRFRSHVLISGGTLTTSLIAVLKLLRLSLSLLAFWFVIVTGFALLPWTASFDIGPILWGIILTVITSVAAVALYKTSNRFFKKLDTKIEGWKGTLIKPIRLKTVEVFSEERIVKSLRGSFRFTRLGTLIAVAYIYLTLVFSFFAFTQTWATTLIQYIVGPLVSVATAFVNFLPNLFFIGVIGLVTRYVIAFCRLIFVEVERGTISLPGFYQEWAMPTYKIVRFLIIFFAVIVIFPYLPGSESDAFKGVSVFLGILLSLGSAGAVSNMIAGLVLTYMRPFKIGDRVKIADAQGDVIERTLLVTRLRTVKNVDITIPNALVLSNHIINFSTKAKELGLILHTSVTIGYDAPWRKVHELLIGAALSTNQILKEPRPFVLQTSLNDFYVTYELNAYTGEANTMQRIYSELHENIQEKFNEAGVEIMSPHYSAIRDGNKTTIPDNYLPKQYVAPSFRIFPGTDTVKKQDPSSET